jgi:lipopolysaccharide biosynthesis glycosyltransferase
VSIIDTGSALACMLKLHSIIEASSSRSFLSFKFLVIDNGDYSNNRSLDYNHTHVANWNRVISRAFPDVQHYETKLWSRPPTLAPLTGNFFEKDVIYARFYLPDIFPECNRLFYLDNDIIVTDDLYNMANIPLINTGVVEHIHMKGFPKKRQMQRNRRALTTEEESDTEERETEGAVTEVAATGTAKTDSAGEKTAEKMTQQQHLQRHALVIESESETPNKTAENAAENMTQKQQQQQIHRQLLMRRKNTTSPLGMVYEKHPFYKMYKGVFVRAYSLLLLCLYPFF